MSTYEIVVVRNSQRLTIVVKSGSEESAAKKVEKMNLNKRFADADFCDMTDEYIVDVTKI